MTGIPDINSKILNCCTQFSSPFNTIDIVEKFKVLYPKDWAAFLTEHEEGGKGCGNFFTAYGYIGQGLRRLADKGEIKFIRWVDAPKDYGNPKITLYENV
jgi:hypothetical protein